MIWLSVALPRKFDLDSFLWKISNNVDNYYHKMIVYLQLSYQIAQALQYNPLIMEILVV